jgi:hypothetical protein
MPSARANVRATPHIQHWRLHSGTDRAPYIMVQILIGTMDLSYRGRLTRSARHARTAHNRDAQPSRASAKRKNELEAQECRDKTGRREREAKEIVCNLRQIQVLERVVIRRSRIFSIPRLTRVLVCIILRSVLFVSILGPTGQSVWPPRMDNL